MKLLKHQIGTVAREIHNQLTTDLTEQRKAITNSPEYKNFAKSKEAKAIKEEVKATLSPVVRLEKRLGEPLCGSSYYKYNVKEAQNYAVKALKKKMFPLPNTRPSVELGEIEHMIALKAINSEDLDQLIADVKKQIAQG